MHSPPTKPYCGLTIILSNPSRFDIDNQQLLSGNAGNYFKYDCLGNAGLEWEACDIRALGTATDPSMDGLRPDTRSVLILGEAAFRRYCPTYTDYALNEQRGYPLSSMFDIPTIASYLPQDCMDMTDHEARLNPLLKAQTDDDSESEGDDDEDDADVKRHGKTARSNYKFWLQRDTLKAARCLNELPTKADYVTIAYPSSAEVISVLSSTKGEDLYLDIETDFEERNLFCIGFSFSNSNTVYVVPFLRYDYTIAYSDFHRILRAFSVAIRNNCVVCHNSMFDLGVLSSKYSLPLPNVVYDTMLAQHRIWPEAEKSLGHTLSAWPRIWEPFHKDEGVFPPRSIQQEKDLWNYNAKDVQAMKLIKREQLLAAATDRGLWDSIAQANSMVKPYLISQFTGIRYDTEKVAEIRKRNDRLMTHYLRAIKILAGHEVLPTSPKQCQNYFFTELNYKPVMRTKTGAPATGEDALQKMKLKYPMNLTIDFMIAYRERAKESGMVKFTPMWS